MQAFVGMWNSWKEKKDGREGKKGKERGREEHFPKVIV